MSYTPALSLASSSFSSSSSFLAMSGSTKSATFFPFQISGTASYLSSGLARSYLLRRSSS